MNRLHVAHASPLRDSREKAPTFTARVAINRASGRIEKRRMRTVRHDATDVPGFFDPVLSGPCSEKNREHVAPATRRTFPRERGIGGPVVCRRIVDVSDGFRCFARTHHSDIVGTERSRLRLSNTRVARHWHRRRRTRRIRVRYRCSDGVDITTAQTPSYVSAFPDVRVMCHRCVHIEIR